MRVTSIILVAAVGTILGLGGAAAFNLAGLIWVGGSFEKALYWEPLESNIAVIFGCISLLGWVISLVTVVLVAKVGEDPVHTAKVKRIGFAAVWISVFFVGVGLVFALVVLPAQYEWVKY
ncbi:hypothetical protein J2Y69_002813 [Microbacterium resistens]|uniref:Uncharacterized protein n=1 Tax=Microbacterium resistens TaxID=156977 RepID=A0ABU1SF09_9MICO|nr:hypothetical protein [Microbacterium resistens]MDR6868199.1 hypothetical protein [Microbacterium resistens]